MTIRPTALVAALVLFCLACKNSLEQSSIETLSADKTVAENKIALDSASNFKTADTLIEQQQAQNPNQKNQSSLTPKPIDWDKKIIKTATINAEVKDYKGFSQQLNEKVKKYGGYISQEEQSQSNYQIENSVVIKVPVDQFDNALNDLSNNVAKLNEKHIASEDVTSQLVDGKSRLEAKKQVRLRYLDLLKQAKNMEEILTVQKEINDIQEEIELVNGRINTLNHQSAVSTINFTFFQIIDANAKTEIEKRPSFLSQVKEAFTNGWNWIGELFIALVSIWPLLTVIVLGAWLFRKRYHSKEKKLVAVAEQKAE